MKKTALVLLVCLGFAASAFGAGSSVTGYDSIVYYGDPKVTKAVMTLSCTADDTNGSFPSTALTAVNTAKFYKQGWYLYLIETDPGSTGPTDDTYDIAITNEMGRDVLEGEGANRDETDSEQIYKAIPVTGALTLAITNNAVNDATVTVKLTFVRDPQ